MLTEECNKETWAVNLWKAQNLWKSGLWSTGKAGWDWGTGPRMGDVLRVYILTESKLPSPRRKAKGPSSFSTHQHALRKDEVYSLEGLDQKCSRLWDTRSDGHRDEISGWQAKVCLAIRHILRIFSWPLPEKQQPVHQVIRPKQGYFLTGKNSGYLLPIPPRSTCTNNISFHQENGIYGSRKQFE